MQYSTGLFGCVETRRSNPKISMDYWY